MRKCDERTNLSTGQTYLISIIPIRKRIVIPMDLFGVPIDPLRFDHLVFQAAVYRKRRVHPLLLGFTVPTFVINLDDPTGRISESGLSELVGRLLANERIEDIYSEEDCNDIFKKYGFYAVRHDIRTLLLLFKKVRHIFVF